MVVAVPIMYEDVPQPQPGPGEVLVRVSATGILVNELRWNETYETPAGSKRELPIPGRDLSGVVVEVGPGVTDLSEGAQVYAMLGYGRDGAEAEYTIAFPSELASKPRTLDAVQAAAVPLSAPPSLARPLWTREPGRGANRPDPWRRGRRWRLRRPTDPVICRTDRGRRSRWGGSR
jgi:NADPH:quinone reductase-like Zn-dependent oxidoreductase